jgi:hypothetical protein
MMTSFGGSAGEGEEIAAAHFTLHLQTEPLQVEFYRSIEVGFQGGAPLDLDLDQISEAPVNIAWIVLAQANDRLGGGYPWSSISPQRLASHLRWLQLCLGRSKALE